MPRAIRLFIIDPQPLIAAALDHLFTANATFHVVGTAQAVIEHTLRRANPDIVLLCQEHGATNVCEAVTACRTFVPDAKIFFVACHPHPELMPRVINAGAEGYGVKDAVPADLTDAVIAAFNGLPYVDPRVGSYPREAGGSIRRVRTLSNLSVRETEVLKLIADGYSNREISIALSLSEKTIKNHISRIFDKLHITARTQAVIHAIKAGIA
jgi:DNA-binding NarL/FixJ family response regulator